MTHRLYYTDSYLRDFEATVIERTNEGRRIYLDRTAFYPTSGGQAHDTGRLGGIEVTEVVDEGERIAHLLAEPLGEQQVAGWIDWPRRFDHMQQHTGQHLLSAVVAELVGHTTVAVHLGKETSTIDLDAAQLTPQQLVQIETRANQVITENRSVEVTFEHSAEATGLRKMSEREGSLRIVTIRDLDRSACGGTHVRATGEIGSILLRRVERVRRAVRLEFVCGSRAVRTARTDHELVVGLAAEFSASAEELPRLMKTQRTDLREAISAQRELEASLDLCRAREMYGAAQPDDVGIRRVVLHEASGSPNRYKGLAQAFVTLPQVIFIGATDSPPSVLLATSSDSGVDAAEILKGLLAAVGGRGGGSANLAQGILPGREQLESVLTSLSQGSQKSKV